MSALAVIGILLGFVVSLLFITLFVMFVTWVACDTVAWHREHEAKRLAKNSSSGT